MQVTRRSVLGSFAGVAIALLTGKWRRSDFDFEFRWAPNTYDVARARQAARDGRGTTIDEILKTLP